MGTWTIDFAESAGAADRRPESLLVLLNPARVAAELARAATNGFLNG
jgi:hypothetical protein